MGVKIGLFKEGTENEFQNWGLRRILYTGAGGCLSSHIKNLKIIIYKTVILPVVLYGCGTWSLTLKEEDGSWRKLHNDELHSLYSSSNIARVIKSRRMRWAGHVACRGAGKSVYRVLVGRLESK
jgi:hypothetical protein